MDAKFRLYKNAVNQLPVKNPAKKYLRNLCPHLSAAELEELTHEVYTQSHVRFITPPLRVRNTYWTMHSTKKKGGNVHIEIENVRRVSRHTQQLLSAKAINYALLQWGDHLTDIMWKDIFCTQIVNLRKLDREQKPTLVRVVCALLSEPLERLLDDKGKVLSGILNERILEATANSIIAAELRGQLEACTLGYNCTFCTAGIIRGYCPCCFAQSTGEATKEAWYTPLPQKMIAALEDAGHKFLWNPALARIEEAKRWEREHK